MLMLAYVVTCAQPVAHAKKQQAINIPYLIAEASAKLPVLYGQNNFKGIQSFINQQRNVCGNAVHIVAIQLLLDVQENNLSAASLNDTTFYKSLRSYVQTLYIVYGANKKPGYYGVKHLEEPSYRQIVFTFIVNWAQRLLERNNLNPAQKFLCNVLAGNVPDPVSTILENGEEYSSLYSAVKRGYAIHRNSKTNNIAFTLGAWLPQGNATALGVHPSAGIVLGKRSKLNQVDFTFNMRFLRTPADYTVMRSGELYKRHTFTGGYAGVDYTHYLLHTANFETGITAGVGYDAFDIANQDRGKNYSDYLRPFEIGCLNINTGVRFNYFFNPVNYIGLEAKYNYLNYHNSGGTPVDGNAVSLSVILGFNTR